jgi:hypothetical protein
MIGLLTRRTIMMLIRTAVSCESTISSSIKNFNRNSLPKISKTTTLKLASCDNKHSIQFTMTGLFSALGKAASFTIRGATVTFGSTIVSCYAACKIEHGANQLIYHFAPHKFANVEYAAGLTQEQLDAVRVYQRQLEDDIDATLAALPVSLSAEILRRHETEHDQITAETRPPLVALQQQNEDETQRQEKNSRRIQEASSSFWKEGAEETISNLIPMSLSGQDVLACSMTG